MNKEHEMHSENSSNPVFGFFTEISIVEHLARNKMERVLPNGMKASHFGVLNHLVRLGKQESPAELASAFQVARPSMTNTIQKIEKMKYVKVVADPLDGRGKLVVITEQGRVAHQQAIAALGKGFAALSKDLGEDLFVSVLPALQKIRRYMDNHRD